MQGRDAGHRKGVAELCRGTAVPHGTASECVTALARRVRECVSTLRGCASAQCGAVNGYTVEPRWVPSEAWRGAAGERRGAGAVAVGGGAGC